MEIHVNVQTIKLGNIHNQLCWNNTVVSHLEDSVGMCG